MNQGFSKGEAEVSREIAALFDLGVSELKDRWRSVYGTEPPPRSSRKLLVSAIAYRMQERAFGGLKPSVRRLLERASEDACERRTLRTRPVTRASDRHGSDPRLAGQESPRHRARPRSSVPQKELPFALASRSRHHRLQVVGTSLLRFERSRRRRGLMERAKSPVQRCAVYTRKSSEEGLEQDFNSLQAQREACEAFIKSQAGEGWRLVKTPYDDGGISGGTMERPALQRLLSDIDEGRIDVVVVYKVDRLTRSLADFAKMVEDLRCSQRFVRLDHSAVQYHHLDGATHIECPALVCAI